MSKKLKNRVRNFRCTEELDELLRNAANEAGCPTSWLLRDFVRECSQLVLSDGEFAQQLRRRYAVI